MTLFNYSIDITHLIEWPPKQEYWYFTYIFLPFESYLVAVLKITLRQIRVFNISDVKGHWNNLNKKLSSVGNVENSNLT